jgi:hypothetical protein
VAHLVVSHNHVGYRGAEIPLNPAAEHRALLAVGVTAATYSLAAGAITQSFGGVQALGNVFHGPGLTHLVQIPRVPLESIPTIQNDLRFEKLVFANNRCDHTQAQPNDNGGTALLYATHPAVQGNQVKGPAGVNAFHLGGRPRVALMGNVSTGGYAGVNNPVPAPFASFNVIL